MSLVQRSRFSDVLKQLLGIKGAWRADVSDGISATVDVGYPPIELDDGVAYWWLLWNTAAPGAGNIQVAQAYWHPTVDASPGKRFVVDGFYLRPINASYTVRYGVCQKAAGISQAGTDYRNAFLGAQVGALPFLTVVQGLATPVATVFGGFTAGLIDVPAPGGAGVQLNPFPGFVVLSGLGLAFTLEVSNVNQALSAVVWGRYVADQT